jgi:oligopeptide transport system permease protein
MTKYLLRRILHGIFSVIVVVAVVMILIYSLMNRDLIFANDPQFQKVASNQKTAYKYSKWEEYGYLDYVTYADWLNELVKNGELTEEQRSKVVGFARKAENDSDEVAEYVRRFTELYEGRGYTVTRLNAIMAGKKLATGGAQQLFAWKNLPLSHRLWEYFRNLITVDNIHAVEEDVGERGLTFTLYDPVYGGNKFSPAILGNGTYHKYLLYFDNTFPWIHQNLVTIQLGKSYSVNMGVDVATTMSRAQGSYYLTEMTYPTGLTEASADDLHSAVWQAGSLQSNLVYASRFVDDYTNVQTLRGNMSKVGYSFVIGIIAVMGAYLLGVPIGVWMARKKDTLVDKIGTVYIVFIIAVPSLAYIFLFKAVGGKLGFPTTFNMESASKLMFVLPIVSLALPSIGGLMRWMRRYMIDQMNSDYVKFARSGGLSESEIFTRHIMKNAAIPLVHGIPASVLGALVGAIITERVYVVPGAGNLLTIAINAYDNGVIVGVTLFYAVLSVVSVILGDVLITLVDPRISFTTKAR